MPKKKFRSILALAAILYLGASFTEAHAAAVRMRIVVLNPSATLTQSKSVRTPLPKEITLQNIKDDGGMELEYDNKEGAFVVFKNDILLEPGETKVYEIIMDDVWMVNEEKLEAQRVRTEKIIGVMKNSKAYERASLVAEGIYAHIDQIVKSQNNQTVSTNQHIAFHRDNLETVKSIEKDIAELEKLLVTAGGTVSLDAVENADLNVKGPDTKTTWIIIFVILIFIGILGGVFYFTWQSQAGSKGKEKDAASSAFKENTPS
jgi:hypothetical protein